MRAARRFPWQLATILPRSFSIVPTVFWSAIFSFVSNLLFLFVASALFVVTKYRASWTCHLKVKPKNKVNTFTWKKTETFEPLRKNAIQQSFHGVPHLKEICKKSQLFTGFFALLHSCLIHSLSPMAFWLL